MILDQVDYKLGLKLAVQRERPHPVYHTTGENGIVYVGGGKYWPGIVVGIKMLRHLGCELPIEVWYRGRCEEVYFDDVKGLGVMLRDVDAEGAATGVSMLPTGTVASGGWEAKLTAMMLTSFSKVLYLDADAYCVADPTPLFDKWDGAHLAFWKDLPQQERTVRWPHVWPNGGTSGVLQIQGGQLLVDRVRGWRMIHLADHICQNSRYFFKFIYGDQDSWRVALSALRLSGYDAPIEMIEKAGWITPAFVCRVGDKPYIVHRCQGKLFAHRHIPPGKMLYANPQYHLPMETKVFDFFAEVMNKREKDSGSVFGEIYARRLWGSQPSGSGSRVKEATPYVNAIEKLRQEHQWQSAVDCGSGDGTVAGMLRFHSYIGLECCPSIVLRAKQHAGEGREFYALDFYKDRHLIPPADVLLCKDVLHHWPREMVTTFLDYLIESKRWRWLAFCQDDRQLHSNQDCPLGGYRALSLSMEPLARYPFTRPTKVFHKTLALIELKKE